MASDRPKIVKREVEFKNPTTKLIFILDNVFTPEECEEYIKRTEKMGYEQALVNVGAGRQKLMTDVRNNDRCIWDSQKEANKVWNRVKEFIPKVWKGRKALGLNERLRFLRYESGQYFAPHFDGSYIRDNGERSYITFQAYLNEGYEGGCTTFLNSGAFRNYKAAEEDIEYAVVPKQGSVLIFQHDMLHEGSELLGGIKYAVRTDVMYSANPIKSDTNK